MVKKCPKCGASIDGENTICPYCKYSLKEGVINSDRDSFIFNEKDINKVKVEENISHLSKKKKILFISIGSFISILLIVVIALIIYSHRDDGFVGGYIEITKPVDSIYTQPENLKFELYKEKGGHEKFLQVSYNYDVGDDEILNIAPKYGGYKVKYYFSDLTSRDNHNHTVKKLIFPDTVTTIYGHVTEYFAELEEIYIPKSVEYIESCMFTDSNGSVKKITVSEENKYFKIKNDALYDERNGMFYYYLKDDNQTQYKVYQAKYVCYGSFVNTNLTSIIFDEGIEILDSAFW